MAGLVKKRIIDRRGRITHVWVRTDVKVLASERRAGDEDEFTKTTGISRQELEMFGRKMLEVIGGKSIALNYTDEQCRVSIDGDKGGIIRTFKWDVGSVVVEHDVMELEPEFQGKGIAKVLLHDMFERYKEMGVKRVDVTANDTVGGFAWAKYGFNAYADWMDEFMAVVKKKRPNAYEPMKKVYDDWKKSNAGAKGFPMHLFANHKNKDVAGALLNLTWYGYMDMNDKAAMEVFNEYVRKR